MQFTAKGKIFPLKAENEELRQHVADLQGMLQQAEETEAGEDTEPVTGGDCDAGAADAATQAAFQFFVGEIEKQTYPKMMHKVARQFRIIQVMNAMGYVPANIPRYTYRRRYTYRPLMGVGSITTHWKTTCSSTPWSLWTAAWKSSRSCCSPT